MTPDAAPLADRPDRRDNGLSAPAYVPIADVDATIADHLLDALRRARIAAYLEPAGASDRNRLFVDADDRGDARTIVSSAARAAAADPARSEPEPLDQSHDLLDGLDTDAEFAAMTAGWHVDTVTAVKQAERDLRREDEDWRSRLQVPPASTEDDEEHYVPPPPPPFPRLAPMTIWAIVVIVLAIGMLAFGTLFGLPSDLTFMTGIAGLLVGGGMLMMRLREHPDSDEDDDGAIV